ncbi:MAG: hypothetical protein ACLFQV_10015 [Vulcanimicrobiota bacterium]
MINQSKKGFFITVCFLFFMVISFVIENSYARSKPFYAEVVSNQSSLGYIQVKTLDEGLLKKIKIDSNTLFYSKNQPRQKNFKAKPSEFQNGDVIVVFSNNPESNTPHAEEIWERKALFYKLGLVQIETILAGEIINRNNGGNEYTIKTFGNKVKRAYVTSETSGIFADKNLSSRNLKIGSKVALICRWPGFLEDEPPTLKIHKIMDSQSFVIEQLEEQFGPIIGWGKVKNVNMKEKKIYVTTRENKTKSAVYGSSTRWIPATPRIKSPADFVGYNTIIFGSPSSSSAKMIINSIGLNSLFEVLIKKGELPGTLNILAFGKVVEAGGSFITVLSKDQRIRCRITAKTLFYQGDNKVTANSVSVGDKVLIKGIIEKEPIGLIINIFK